MITTDSVVIYANAALPYLGVISTALYVVAHCAAIFGSPKAGEDAGKIQQVVKVIIDAISANYGKAKNQ